MVEASLEHVIELAEAAQLANKSWHFHILAPTCCFNPRRDLYGLVVEVPADKTFVVAYVAERPVEQGKRLVTLLHGSKVLEGASSSSAARNSVAAKIAERARTLNEHNISWHHHMLFPNCALNQHPGHWNITFEDPQSGETLSALYEPEPIDDLKEIEALFYRL
jgi:hypothetical protein